MPSREILSRPGFNGDCDQYEASSTDLATVIGLSGPAIEPIGGCNEVLCGMEIGHSSIRGCREFMEDAFVIEPLDELQNHCFLAILDGHAGDGAANIASKKIKHLFCQTKQWQKYVEEVLDSQQLTSGISCSDDSEDEDEDEGRTRLNSSPKSTISSSNSRSNSNSDMGQQSITNRERTTSGASTGSGKRKREGGDHQKKPLSPTMRMKSIAHSNAKNQDPSYTLSKGQLQSLSEGLRDAYIAMDRHLLECEDMDTSGSTLVCVITTPSHILCANVGDSRAVVSCANGEAHALSVDHKPDNPPEKARIERAGSFVAIERVNGELAMSRALGDFQYKQAKHMDISQQAVTCIPEISFHTRVNHSNSVLVLACDGVWDVLTNQEVVSFVQDHLLVNDTSITMEEAAEAIIDLSLRQGSTDNISAIVCLLNGNAHADTRSYNGSRDRNGGGNYSDSGSDSDSNSDSDSDSDNFAIPRQDELGGSRESKHKRTVEGDTDTSPGSTAASDATGGVATPHKPIVGLKPRHSHSSAF